MKKFVMKAVAGVVLAMGATALAQAAEEYPTRPIRIVLGSAPGGLLDISTRLAAQLMSVKLGQPVTVENRPGADTLLAARHVKASPPDGYTLLAVSNTITIQPVMKLDPGYELKDYVGIGPIVRSPWVMLVAPSQPYKNVADFIATARARPQGVTFASGGVGTSPYMAEETFLKRAGVKLLHVPYKGIPSAMPDVMSGRVSMIFDAIGSSAGNVRGGRLLPLGVTSLERLPAFPEIPTMAEQGMPGFSSYVTIGLIARSDTPKDIVSKLATTLQGVVNSKEMRERFEPDGAEPIATSPEEYTEFLKREMTDFGKLATDLGLQKQ